MKHESIRRLNGPAKRVYFAVAGAGIGDVIHAMPVVWQMIQDGYRVTVNCRPFVNYLWESIGAKVTNFREPLGLDWDELHGDEYGSLFQPREWNYAFEDMNRFDSFAQEIGMPVPRSFSWIDILKPGKTAAEYVLFAPESTETNRSIPRARKVYKSLTNAVWLSQGSRLVSLKEWRKMERIAPNALAHKTGIQSEAELIERREAEALALRDTVTCGTAQELLSLVWNAECVVSAENGVAAIAAAFGKPLTVYCGVTGAENTIGQFRRFHPVSYEVMPDAMDRAVRDNSLTNGEKIQAMRELMDASVPGAVAEVGVYKGGTARLLAREFPMKPCYFFDTFEGMPFSDSEDVHKAGDFCDVTLAAVEKILEDCSNARCIKGIFPETAKPFRDMKFSFVYLDGDQYRTTKDALEFFWPRMSAGGIIALDDYQWPNCPGVERAIKEFGKPVHSPVPCFAFIKKEFSTT